MIIMIWLRCLADICSMNVNLRLILMLPVSNSLNLILSLQLAQNRWKRCIALSLRFHWNNAWWISQNNKLSRDKTSCIATTARHFAQPPNKCLFTKPHKYWSYSSRDLNNLLGATDRKTTSMSYSLMTWIWPTMWSISNLCRATSSYSNLSLTTNNRHMKFLGLTPSSIMNSTQSSTIMEPLMAATTPQWPKTNNHGINSTTDTVTKLMKTKCSVRKPMCYFTKERTKANWFDCPNKFIRYQCHADYTIIV